MALCIANRCLVVVLGGGVGGADGKKRYGTARNSP